MLSSIFGTRLPAPNNNGGVPSVKVKGESLNNLATRSRNKLRKSRALEKPKNKTDILEFESNNPLFNSEIPIDRKLYNAVKDKKFEVALSLIDEIGDKKQLLNYSDSNGFTPLFHTIFIPDDENSKKIAKKLIDAGANLDHTDNRNLTALIWLCNENYSKHKINLGWRDRSIIFDLINNGANLDIIDFQGITALDYAIANGLSDIVSAIKTKGGHTASELIPQLSNSCIQKRQIALQTITDAEARAKGEKLFDACNTNRGALALRLISEGAYLDFQKMTNKDTSKFDKYQMFYSVLYTPGYFTPLMTAIVVHINKEVIDNLIEAGANIDIVDNYNRNALILASALYEYSRIYNFYSDMTFYANIIADLVKKGAKLNVMPKDLESWGGYDTHNEFTALDFISTSWQTGNWLKKLIREKGGLKGVEVFLSLLRNKPHVTNWVNHKTIVEKPFAPASTVSGGRRRNKTKKTKLTSRKTRSKKL